MECYKITKSFEDFGIPIQDMFNTLNHDSFLTDYSVIINGKIHLMVFSTDAWFAQAHIFIHHNILFYIYVSLSDIVNTFMFVI
jgi:hypothetical protein